MGSQWETHLESNYFFVLMIIKYYLLRIIRDKGQRIIGRFQSEQQIIA